MWLRLSSGANRRAGDRRREPARLVELARAHRSRTCINERAASLTGAGEVANDVDLRGARARSLMAFSVVVVTRWSSSNQSICSAVAPGMNSVVNMRQKAGVELAPPDPHQRDQGARPARAALLPYIPQAARPRSEAAVEHEVGSRVGVADGEGDRHLQPPREIPRSAERVRRRRRRRPPRGRRPTVSSVGWSMSRSDKPQPRSSWRISVWCWSRCSRPSDATSGSSRSNSRWVSQLPAFTSGGPLPWLAYAMRVPSRALTKRTDSIAVNLRPTGSVSCEAPRHGPIRVRDQRHHPRLPRAQGGRARSRGARARA